MGESTKIQWAHHTFNPWRGCTKVSPGCQHCYAETLSKRNPAVLGVWGDQGTRVVAAESYWKGPIRWNLEAKRAKERRRVFCASLADVFEDRPELVEPRRRLWGLINQTPYLDWLLLTKRPENADRMAVQIDGPKGDRGLWPRNVWLGTTCEDQQRADERIPHLLAVPAAVRFLSVEPMLGRVDLTPWIPSRNTCAMRLEQLRAAGLDAVSAGPAIDWVIVGGESGGASRPFHYAWARSLVAQCGAAGVPMFVKQVGSFPLNPEGESVAERLTLNVKDPKGGVMEEWPEDLRVRQVPPPREEPV